MQIMVLTCTKATFYSSIRNIKKLNIIRRLQLMLHLSMCKDCHEFDHQSQLIDKSLKKFGDTNILSDELLSSEKRTEIKHTINQSIN